MAYTKTQWNTGDPITQERMNKIEQGIADAHSLESSITAAQSTASGAATQANTNAGKIASLETDVGNLQTSVQQNAAYGQEAMIQIHAATDSNETAYNNLDERFTAIESAASTEAGKLAGLITEVTTARGLVGGVAATNLKQKIDDIDTSISALSGGYQSVKNSYDQARGTYNSLSDRLTADESNYNSLYSEVDAARKSNGTLKDHFDDIDGAINAAKQSAAQNQTYDSMDARFEAIETELVGARGGQTDLDTRLDNIESNASGLSSDKVDKSSIANNLTTTTEGKVLDARQGKELNDKKVNYTDIKDDLVSTDADKPLSAKQGKALADRIDLIDNSSTGTVHGLDTRVTALETELDMSSTAGERRLDDIETRLGLIDGAEGGAIDAINDKINAIAEELDMLDEGAIVATNSRIDSVESDVTTLKSDLNTTNTGLKDRMTAAETDIGTLDADLNTTDTGLKDRMTAAETAIGALETTVNTTTTGLVDKVGALESTVGDQTTGLAATKNIADGAAAGVTSLGTRVTALEGKDTIVVAYDGEHSNFTNDEPNIASPLTTADYLVQGDDGKYYYWRYFGAVEGWQLISSAGTGGGTGSSSGEFAASLDAIDTPDENTDYFVGNNTIGYTHYRYIQPSEVGGEGTFVRILPKGLLINAGVTANGGLEAYTVEDSVNNVFDDFVAFKDVEANPVTENDVVVSTNLVFTDTNGQTHTVNVQGGGGGAGSSTYTMRLNNTLSSLKLTVPKKDGYTAYIKGKVVVKDAGVIDDTFDQSHTITVAVAYSNSKNGPWTNYTSLTALNNTEFSVDVTSILTLGQTTYIRAQATTTIDEEDKTSSLIYEVTQVEMSIAAVNFNQATVRTTNFNFQYRCIGSGLTKQVHFLIDGTDITGSPVTTTLHNDIAQQTIPLTGLQTGMHSFRVYFTVGEVESNELNYYIIYNNDNTRQAPIVALAAEKSTITYGDDLKINYTVATIGTETTDEVVLELYALDGSTEVMYSTATLEGVTNERVDTWRPVEYPESGTAYIRATATHSVGGVDYTDTKTIQLTINELQLPAGYSLDPSGTSNLVYKYDAYGRSNNDAGKEVYHHTYHALTGQDIEWTGAFNGFNWSGDGYVDGQTLTISGGATHTVNVPIFQNAYNGITLENSEGVSDISKMGRTVEIEYEVASATDLNDVIIDYMSNVTTTTENGVTQKGGVGFQVTPQSCYLLKSGSTLNTDSTGFILNESDIAAAYLTPGMRIHLAFVIEPWSDTQAYDRSYHQSVNIYVNGEFANACPYVQGTDSFASSATLRIGSSSCIIKLYQIKMYNRGLTHREILQNYKVAPAATRDKLTRLYDNDILNADGLVDYEKARTKYTCLLLTGPEPVYTETTGGETVLTNPTVSPYKGYPSPAGRKNKKTGKTEGKTESGVTLTKANPNTPQGYDVEFDLRDVIPTDQNVPVEAYLGARGAYVSSNNVQGTSSQKYPVHNLKVYLAKWSAPKTTTTETEVEDGAEIPEGAETITRTYKQVPHESDEGYDLVEVEEGEDTTGLTTETKTFIVETEFTPGEIKKVKYSLKGKDEHGDDIGYAESTLCWKADYMSTDHANTFNANIADGLFTDTLPGASWDSKHQNTVYGIRCLLFQKQGTGAYEFLGDGCLNNDKGNNKTYDLERSGDKDNDTASQKWEFTNNSDDLGYFKTDTLQKIVGEGADAHIQALDAFESTYPDQGDLDDAGKIPNYNHLQILLTWLSKRANYWDENDASAREAKKQIFINEFTRHINMNHALAYYIFSEYIALCDNRVKNMFLRSDNVKSEVIKNVNGDTILEGNGTPDALWSNYVGVDGTTDPTYIDWTNSTFAVWAPVLYDLDSCFGVENVGYIRVRYDAGWDYTWNNAPQFNGYESRLWLQFADCFDSEIKAAALTLYNRSDGLNYTNFYRKQITDNLANISPALSNQDMLVKFDKPWSEGFINYSLAEPAMETPYYKYLQRGSRTAQKTAFMNMRSKLLSSKYGATEFTNDSIKFRTGVPVGASGNIIGYDDNEDPIYGDGDLTQTQITVKANQVMYPGVAYGDNKAPTRSLTNGGKVNAGESCVIQATSAVQGNDGIFICGASILTDIGDISAFRPYQIDVGAGVNLKRLIVGSNAAGYTNGNTDSFQNLHKCVLLEEINVQKCSNVSSLDLSNNPLIKKVYAAGSGATTIIFPNGGVLDTVEYSAVTGNITILNQKNLAHFSYENSQNNHYSSLTKLWIENTPNVPIVEIINTALGHLTAGVRITGLDIDLYDGASTEEEIAAALETTTLFLNTLVSDLAVGKYLDNAGAFTPGNTQRPTITGKVHITSIRNSLLEKLHTMYPNLIVYNTIDSNGTIGNNIITEYTIEYRNYDNTLLYTDYRTGYEHFIDPASLDPLDIDPITNDRRIPVPTKPEDAQYKYTFGSYENDEYIRYSGWVKQYTTTNPVDDDYPQGNTVFIASYPTTQIQQYVVNWYEEPGGIAIKSYQANYGIDISGYTQPEEDSSLTKVKVGDNSIKVFKGWDRPVGKVTGNTNVYAQWEESTIDNAVQASDITMANLTAADLAAIARLGAEAKRRILEDKLGNDPVMVQMGCDFNYTSGVTTHDLLNGATKYIFNSQTTDAKIFDGAHGTLPEVRPLSVNSDWTLAIDYKFLLTSALYTGGQEYVLASCYSNVDSSIQGFKLSLVKNNTTNSTEQYIRVTWGTQTQTIDYVITDNSASNSKQYARSYRNMVVLRHRAATPTQLYIYFPTPALASVNTFCPLGGLTDGVTNTYLTWSNNSTIDAPLILGGNYADPTAASPQIENDRNGHKPAKGIIYWAKFWDVDLGEKNCNILAQWTHEKIPFYLSGYDNNTTPTRQILEDTNLSFVAAQAVGDRYQYVRLNDLPTTSGYFGWRESDARSICNNRIFKGMSMAFRSILIKSGVDSVTINTNNESDIRVITTEDYCYLPSECEVQNKENVSILNKASEVLPDWPSPWPWLQASNIHNWYGFISGTTTLELQTAPSAKPFLYRFIGNYIKPTARIFNINVDPYNNGNTWTYNNTQISVQSGDVWVTDDVAYIYYTNAEINEGIYVDIPTDGGGWKKADVWHLRTYSLTQATAYENQFEKIDDTGSLMTSFGNTTRRADGRILCPEFSI